MIHWLQNLSQNPIYLREKGGWGKPNPIYASISRYSPFIVIGGIFLGICAGFTNPALFANNDELAIFWCILCLPGILLTMLTLVAQFLVPALTAPTISLERAHGTWDMLRVTPQSTQSILWAKLFGSLARLPIWPVLLLLSAFQALIWFCLSFTLEGQFSVLSLAGVMLAFTALLRPWLEILFAALMGLLLSTTVRSATTALAATYALIVAFKLLNSTGVWLVIGQLFNTNETFVFLFTSTFAPTAVYALGVCGLGAGIWYQAGKLDS